MAYVSKITGCALTLILGCAFFACDSDAPEATFSDVSTSHPAWSEIEAVHNAGVMQGCSTNPLRFCPDSAVLREEMTADLLRALLGGDYSPPPATGVFDDVHVGNPGAPWIEAAVSRGITSGCDGSSFCPFAPVTRGQMAIFLLKTLEGSGYSPQAATGDVYDDVPEGHLFAAWIEEVAARGGTKAIGCGSSPSRFCPGDVISRGQMAVWLEGTFDL